MSDPEYNMDGPTYEKLYKRFISDAKTERLVKMIDCKGKIVLDLCAGNLRLSKKAIDLGAKGVVAIDENPNISKALGKDEYMDIVPVQATVSDVIYAPAHTKSILNLLTNDVEVIYCQQAINYWFSFEMIRDLAKKFFWKKDVQFCFNTFNAKPTLAPQTKTYQIDGLTYVETWQLVDERTNACKHLQCCEGMTPHYTEFKWIDREEYKLVLEAVFEEVSETVEGSTSIWLVKGKKDAILVPWSMEDEENGLKDGC